MDHFSILMERGDKNKKPSAARRLATGAIVGIAIACLVVFLGMLLCCYCCCFRRRRRERSRELESQPHKPSNKLDKLRRMMRGNQNKDDQPQSTPAAGPETAQYPQVQQPGPVYK